MQRRHLTRPRFLTAGIVLAALLLRATIPDGFMPSSARAFTLQICGAGLMPAEAALLFSTHGLAPVEQHAAHHAGGHGAGHEGHGGHEGHSTFDHCPFGSLPVAGPSAHLAFAPPPPVVNAEPTWILTARPVSRPERAHPARGPPPA